MSELDKYLSKLKEELNPNPPVKAVCENCGWEGKPEECKSEWEQDGWENPGYWVAICPKCKEPDVMFLTAKDLEDIENDKTV